MNGNFDIDKLSSQIIKSSGGKIDRNGIERLKKGDMSALFGTLSAEDRAKLKKALENKEISNKILSSKQAQDIMNGLKGNKENGRTR